MPLHQKTTRARVQLLFDWPEAVRDGATAGSPSVPSPASSNRGCVDADSTSHATRKRQNDQLIPLPDGPERQALLAKYAEYTGTEAAEELDRFCRPVSSEAIAEARSVHASTTSTTIPDSHGSVTTAEWDFRNSFPKPISAIAREQPESDNFDWEAIKSVHEGFSQELSAILGAIDVIDAAKMTGVNPHTGKQPVTSKERQALDRFFEDEPAGLRHVFSVRMDEYAAIFGPSAAAAFRRFLRNMTPKK